MTPQRLTAGLGLLCLACPAFAQAGTSRTAPAPSRAESSISATLTVPAGVNLRHIFVAACAENDQGCMKGVVRIVPLSGEDRAARAGGERIAYVLPDLPPGKYSLFALNDLNGDLTHDPDAEEFGACLTPDIKPNLVPVGTKNADFPLFPIR